MRLSAIEGMSLPEAALMKRPSFGFGLLLRADELRTFLDAFDWVLSEIKKAEQEEEDEVPVGG